MITIRDIALACHVSQSTVSIALRNDPRVCKATRLKIQSKAAELGYRPNPLVTSLMTSIRLHRPVVVKNAIALVNQSVETAKSPVMQELLHGAFAQSVEHGFSIEEISLCETKYTEKRLYQILASRGIRGVYYIPSMTGDYFLEPTAEISKLAIVAHGKLGKIRHLHRVRPETERGIIMAIKEIVQRGYKRIGYLGRRHDAKFNGSRGIGVIWIMQEILRKSNPEITLEIVDDRFWDDGSTLFESWVRSSLAPTALVAFPFFYSKYSDIFASKPISQLGFCSLGEEGGAPHMSCIRDDYHTCSTTAIDLLADQLYRNNLGFPLTPHEIVVPPSFVEGKTLAPHCEGIDTSALDVL